MSNYLSLQGDSGERGITPMKHIHQLDTWDCGLTCIQMILHWLHQSDDDGEMVLSRCFAKDDQVWMRELIGTDSIWTIDLVRILHRAFNGSPGCGSRDTLEQKCIKEDSLHSDVQMEFSTSPDGPLQSSVYATVSFLFCSTNLGVDQSYNRIGYYRDAFQRDAQRVEQLFAVAVAESMPLLQVQHLSLKVLVDFVSRKGCVAIVLVDNRVLLNHGTIHEDPNKNEQFEFATNNQSNTSYSGHYVVLCGISYDSNDVCYAKSFSSEDSFDDNDFCMVLKNPGSWKDQELVTAKRFEEAWRSNGTDEDVIIINRRYS
eukprot:CCRYP_001849-RA/>CCRYP_001849-RA protein AED:0.06 eAED:0.04 QI:0/0/0/0.5/1/1/2/0/314